VDNWINWTAAPWALAGAGWLAAAGLLLLLVRASRNYVRSRRAQGRAERALEGERADHDATRREVALRQELLEAEVAARERAERELEIVSSQRERFEREINAQAAKRISEVKMVADREVRAIRNLVRPFDIEKDLAFLFFLIDHELDLERRYVLEPRREQQVGRPGMLKTEELQASAEVITQKILELLGDVYHQEALLRYLADEAAITAFVASLVNKAVMDLGVEMNKTKLVQLHAGEFSRRVSRATQAARPEQVPAAPAAPRTPAQQRPVVRSGRAH